MKLTEILKFDISPFKFKSISESRGREGYGVCLEIFKDNEFVCSYEDYGDGGQPRINFRRFDKKAQKSFNTKPEVKAEFLSFVKDWLTANSERYDGKKFTDSDFIFNESKDGCGYHIDRFVCIAMDSFDIAKKLRKEMKTKTLFCDEEGNGNCSYRTIKYPVSHPSVIPYLKDNHPKAIILNLV